MLASELKRVRSAERLAERAVANAKDGESVLIVVELPSDGQALAAECFDGFHPVDSQRVEGCALYSQPDIDGGIVVCPAYRLPDLAKQTDARFSRVYLMHVNPLHREEVIAVLDMADMSARWLDIWLDEGSTRIGLFRSDRDGKDGDGDE